MEVSLQSLKHGINEFAFDANLSDIAFDGAEFVVRKIEVKSIVDKNDQAVLVKNKAIANVDFVCGSCLKGFSDKIEDEFTIFYTTSAESAVDDEMVRLLTSGTNHIDLAEGLREAILLSLPISFKCTGKCAGLCAQCGVDLNEEKCSCKKEEYDHRWDGLKKLLEPDSDHR